MTLGINLRDFLVAILRGRVKSAVAELASFSEASRKLAFERFELLRVHIEDGRPLAASCFGL